MLQRPRSQERFEVSVRTIYRDIDLLSGAGIPVYCSRGRGGGVSLLPDFVLDKSLLSESGNRMKSYCAAKRCCHMRAGKRCSSGSILCFAARARLDRSGYCSLGLGIWGSDEEAD